MVQINEKYLFLEREDNGLMEIPGGGFEEEETDYTGVVLREIEEETGLKIERKKLQLCGLLVQRLKKDVSARYGGLKHGFVFLHYSSLYIEPKTIPTIRLSDEHRNYRLYSYDEIVSNYKDFSSGPLWMFFTFLAYQQTKKLQEGLLYDRRNWQGKEFVVPTVTV